MCDDEKYSKLNQHEHYMTHAMLVRQRTAEADRGVGGVTLAMIIEQAEFALELADKDVDSVCKQRLSDIVLGNLDPIAEYRSLKKSVA